MNKITKAVIPAAGMGTRLLPATKAVAKEMLPIINIPTIQHIVQEAVESGIKEVLIVISDAKQSIVNHFKRDIPFEKFLIGKKKDKYAKAIKDLAQMAKISFIYQKEANGLGDAIGYAQKWAKNQPFAVLLGDDVVVNLKGKPSLEQCMDAYYKTGKTIVGVQPVEKKVINKYGIVAPISKNEAKKQIFSVKDLVEKPEANEAPSNLAILGRYILSPAIFAAIKKTKKDKSGEIQLTNALRLLAKNKKDGIAACVFKGTRYDLGNKLGMVKATIDFALMDDELKDDVLKFIKSK